jgi:putative ABC transport system permease protein
VNDLFSDVRMGFRQLRRAPSVAAAAVLTLALGIGSTTAVFSFVAGVMSVSRPVDDMERRVALWSHNRGESETKRAVSPADFLDWHRRATSVDQIVATRRRFFNLSGSGLPVRVSGSEVSPGYVEFFQIRPAAGRSFNDDDARRGAPRVAIASERFWRTQLASNPNLVGQTIRLDGEPVTVVGVLPPRPDFDGILVPLSLETLATDRADRSLFVWGRLKPGISIGQARGEMEAIGRALETEYPATNRGWTINTQPLRDEFIGPQARLAFGLLLAMAVTVLVIGCFNIANLLLARGVARRGEFAVRKALGAGSWRIARQLLMECGVIVLVGAAASLFVARWVIALFDSNFPLESPWVDGSVLSLRMLGVTAAGALLATVVAGLLPALTSRRINLVEGLHEAGRNVSGGSQRRIARVLVGAQVALAVVLLIVAGLLARTMNALQRLEPGFDVTHLLSARVALPATVSEEAAARWFAEAIERGRAIPGVTGAAGASRLPFAGSRFNPNRSLLIEGRATGLRPDEGAFAIDYVVSPGYFATMKLPLKEGREFSPGDDAGAPFVAVISETLARRYWAGRSPLGVRLRQGDEPQGIWRTVVGVVGDVRNDDADQPPLPYLYLPLAQHPQRAFSIVVRTTGRPEALADTLRRAIAAYDPQQPLFDVQSMEAILDADLRQSVVLIEILNGFAAVALGLAGLGIWGVVSQLVAQRSKEIGVRMALGATAAQVTGLVARVGLLPVAIGLIFGLGAGLVMARLFRSVLFGVTPADPLTLIATCGLMLTIAVCAIASPVRRALRLDPVQVLRSE